MNLTSDWYLFIIGILLGVVLTIIGIGFTEYLKSRKEKIRLTTAFKNEVLTNLQKANFNLSCYEEANEDHKKARHAFYTTAYEQLKLAILIDWTKSKLASNIFDGFIFTEEYNKRLPNPECFEKEMGSEKAILKQIKKNMFVIDQVLKNYKNIEIAFKKEK